MRTFRGLDIRRVHRGESTAAIGESAAAGEKVNVAGQFRTLSTLADDLTELRMAKVLFLGSGRCGKTTVSKALRWSRYSDEERARLAETEANPCPLGGQRSTANIRLDTLGMTGKAPGTSTPVETDVHLWDFGGQEIYHNTHRLFASEGAVFVIVTTSPEEWRRRVDDDIKHGHTLGLTEEEFRRENTYRELAYWLDYVWEARGMRGNASDMSDPRAPRVLVVFTGPEPPAGESVKDFLRKQAGGYESLIGRGIAVEAADICESFKLGRNPMVDIDQWISEHAVGVADELGVRVPKLYKALAEDCTKVARGELRAATPTHPALAKKLDGLGWLDLVRSHDLTTRTDREWGEIAHGAARYLHECGRLFFLERLRENTLILDQKWGVDLVYRVTNPSARARRLAIQEVTRREFPREKLWSVLHDDDALAQHEEFIFQLLVDCNLILSLGSDSYLAIHPELLDDLDRETDQALFRQWEEVRPGQHQGTLVNHSFVIHDTGKGLLLGRNAFQRIVAHVGRTESCDLPEQLFFAKLNERETDHSRVRRRDTFRVRHEIAVWKDGFQLHLLCETMPQDATAEWLEPSSFRKELSEVLILRMEWRPFAVDSGFRGGIFVQMLCSDEQVKAERLREFLCGVAGEEAARTGRATQSDRHLGPLCEYRLDGERPDLVIDDLRPEGLAPEIARALRGVGQPGWLRTDGPKSMIRYDVAISYRRKSSEAFVKGLHRALKARGLHCYFDQLQVTGDRHLADQNTLVQIYERLRLARVLIVVPSVTYFTPPTSSLTGADNIFCPVELAEAVLAGSADVPPRPPGRFFWVRPEDVPGIRGWWDRIRARWLPWGATRGHVAVDQLQGQIVRLVDRTSKSVIEPRIDRNRAGEAFERENESISDARKNRKRLGEWSASVTHGTDQYLIAPSQPDDSGPAWDFSAIVEHIDAALRRS
jgi:GTPase SAR1 family protein